MSAISKEQYLKGLICFQRAKEKRFIWNKIPIRSTIAKMIMKKKNKLDG